MAVEERDKHSGYMTTGHVWNGIKELNTPVPRAVWLFLAGTVIFSVVYWLLMPAWPVGITYTKGLLGIDQRTTVAETLKEAALARSEWTQRIDSGGFQEIQADPRLMTAVRQTGHRLFVDNCAVCHGTDAKGGKGYPNLTTTSWLWGGDTEQIAETIRVGINSTHPDTRVSQMPAVGRDQMMPSKDIPKVVRYVLGLSDPAAAGNMPASDRDAARELFAANCAACHGEDARGKIEMGAPDLTDRFWIYGGDQQSVLASVWDGRQGHMPTWEARLSPLERKILTLYLVDLRAKTP